MPAGTRSVPQVSPQLPVSAAVALMDRYRAGQLPVVERGTCVGMLTRHDVASAEPRNDPRFPLLVGEVCQKPAPVVRAGTTPARETGPAVVLYGTIVLGVWDPAGTEGKRGGPLGRHAGRPATVALHRDGATGGRGSWSRWVWVKARVWPGRDRRGGRVRSVYRCGDASPESAGMEARVSLVRNTQ
ncbi:CBS domain-containing protein [Amycolatopsis sp. PS_44_ISF1]|uniref:CBS domain-containing protein n=1 Tax=Amycolatopsis sp. PS_44_ISF1 TaxID=2974917 RepID=UPI0037C01FDE